MKKMKTKQLLENYLYDINISDNIFITLDKSKIDFNGEKYKKHTMDVMDIDNTNYYIIIYEVGKNTILTIIENKETVNSQFLIKSKEVLNNLKIDDLTKYVNFQVANLVIEYFI